MHMPVWQSADARWVKPPGSITGLLAAACRIGIAAGLLLLGEAVHPVDAQPVEDPVPDQIMVKGQILNVRIIRFDASGVTYRSEFGKGEITTAYTDLEGVSSRSAFRIVYGEDNEAVGRLLGFRDNRLLIGDSPSAILHVPVEGIQVCVPARDYYGSRWTRLRTDYRHWNADLSLGVNYEQGAVGKCKLEFGMALSGEALYMPELSDPGRNWLFRWMIDFAVPLYDPLALRLRIREENDNNPDPAVGDNKFTTSLAMIFRF